MDTRLFAVVPKYGFCNSKGELIVSARFDDACSNENFNSFKVGNKWGFLDNSGNCLKEAQYDEIYFHGKYVVVKKNGLLGVLNASCQKVRDIIYTNIYYRRDMNEEFVLRYVMKDKDGYFSILDSDFECIKELRVYDGFYKVSNFAYHTEITYYILTSSKNKEIYLIDRNGFEYCLTDCIYDTFTNLVYTGTFDTILAQDSNDDTTYNIIFLDKTNMQAKVFSFEGCDEIKYITQMNGYAVYKMRLKESKKCTLYKIYSDFVTIVKEFENCDAIVPFGEYIYVRRGKTYSRYGLNFEEIHTSGKRSFIKKIKKTEQFYMHIMNELHR